MKGLTIAVDGPSSAGKGTVAKGVARSLGYAYLDTGAMYRAVALIASRKGLSLDDEASLAEVAVRLTFAFEWNGEALKVIVDGEDVTGAIRTGPMGQAASAVSRHPAVRRALTVQQRRHGDEGGVVMDGRDIGTVVLPDADLKVFLDGDLDERARRRHQELRDKGDDVTFEEVRGALEQRDRQDRERATAPLRQAEDAVRVDTTHMTIREAIEQVLALVDTELRARRGR